MILEIYNLIPITEIMKKISIVSLAVLLTGIACSGTDNSNVPAGTDQPATTQSPTVNSADSGKGYADTTARYRDTTKH